MLKEANTTTIALVPKCENPSFITDFRPISCCNRVYKCIAKIMANRLSKRLSNVVDMSQGAFVSRVVYRLSCA